MAAMLPVASMGQSLAELVASDVPPEQTSEMHRKDWGRIFTLMWG